MSEAVVSYGPAENVTLIRFSVHGDPAPQGSKRHVGKGIMVEASKDARPWRAEITHAALDIGLYAPLDGPVQVNLLFRFRRNKSHFGTGKNQGVLKATAPTYKFVMPDVDKLARAALDALVLGGLIRDDGQVAVLVCEKRYAAMPGLSVEIRPLA